MRASIGCYVQELLVSAPDDGKSLGDFQTSISVLTSSISGPYNGITQVIPVNVKEQRQVGLQVCGN